MINNIILIASMAALAYIAGDELDKKNYIKSIVILISMIGIIYGVK
jgi:hypothetical protein